LAQNKRRRRGHDTSIRRLVTNDPRRVIAYDCRHHTNRPPRYQALALREGAVMSAITHVRFYPSDWLAGTRGMTASETGIYITLIALMYENAGPIPDNPARLARLCGASNSSFASGLESLICEGKIARSEGHLTNGRAEKEISYIMEMSGVAREKAKSRWGKKPTKTTKTQCNGNAAAMLTSSQYSLAPTEHRELLVTDVTSRKKPPKKIAVKEKVYDLLTDILTERNAQAVIDHREAINKPLTVRGAELLVEKLKLAENMEDAAEMMIARSWQGFEIEWYRNAKARANGAHRGN
jgi:uncharacterized protein YdaU (DUF1376 family)